jgi:peptidylprolyl isomerase
MRRAVILTIVLAGCSKTEPTKSEATRSSAARAPAPRVVEHAPTPAGPRPSLPPPSSDFNPPGVPQLLGEVHEGESGLQYIDEVVGTGPAPVKGKPVKVHYTGWLTDGTEFDSSHVRDQPIVIPFNAGVVIKGWDLGLETMRVGGKRRLRIPADIAYGAQGAGDAIPPDAVLLFDIELVDVDVQ